MSGLPKQCRSCGGFGCGSPCGYENKINSDLAAHGYAYSKVIDGVITHIPIEDVRLGKEGENICVDEFSEDMFKEYMEQSKKIQPDGYKK